MSWQFSSVSWSTLFQCCHMSHTVRISCLNNSVVHLLLLNLYVFQYLACLSCHFVNIMPSNIFCQPSCSCSLAASEGFLVVWFVGRPCCHCHRPFIILYQSCGAVLCSWSQSLSFSSAAVMSQLLMFLDSELDVVYFLLVDDIVDIDPPFVISTFSCCSHVRRSLLPFSKSIFFVLLVGFW